MLAMRAFWAAVSAWYGGNDGLGFSTGLMVVLLAIRIRETPDA
jgi:hypothetical protein